jgi:hypothetical protein
MAINPESVMPGSAKGNVDLSNVQEVEYCKAKDVSGGGENEKESWLYDNDTQQTIEAHFAKDWIGNPKLLEIKNIKPKIKRVVKETDFYLGNLDKANNNIADVKDLYNIYAITPTTNTSVKIITWKDDNRSQKESESVQTLQDVKYNWKVDTIALGDRSLEEINQPNNPNGRVKIQVKTRWSASLDNSRDATMQDDIYLQSHIKHKTTCFGDKECKIDGWLGSHRIEDSENRKKLQDSERLKDFGEGVEKVIDLNNNRSQTNGAALLKDDQETRKVKLSSLRGKSINSYNGKSNVWILSHGWNGELDVMNSIGENILNDQKFNGDIVMILDWRQASHTSMNVCTSSTWTQQISEGVQNRLSEWGLNDPSKIRVIGHSMGTILSTEIGLRYSSNLGMGIMLDPPSDPCIGGYIVDYSDRDFNQTRKSDLNKASSNTRALVGAHSISGNQDHAKTAQKSFRVNFQSTLTNDSEHGWVQELFRNMINQNQNPTDRLQNDILGVRDQSKHETWERDGWGIYEWQGHNGILKTVKKDAGIPFFKKADKINPGDLVQLKYREANKIRSIYKE